jgi:hypothetical protein
MTDLYKMKLHETVVLKEGYLSVLRVHGGWIYTTYDGVAEPYAFNISSVFVPYP